ncbi:type III-A CRISPR-associated protein Cas10/Csm1 [Planktothrix agardhii]|uniref:type III-A CRISPR-associated protein Cas10/Csm1 n=1 Tax=Planktothrix agardhii TaxID=1160 RepID=UPI001D09EDBC|nr:type III-A CRISPR-associated protein Cas10/Csm1 [Planktothrix agardhii]MCB8762220.1 type III-A CRISPR-associated protein Cas10/Csm1 [Planktothrix agardhii 1813]
MKSHDVALQVMQETVEILAKWADFSLPWEKLGERNQHEAVNKAKIYLHWPEDVTLQPLRLLFDFVSFDETGKNEDNNEHYYPVGVIANVDPVIPYPLDSKPNLTDYQKFVKDELEKLKLEDRENLSLLTLLIEKYGSCLSYGDPNIALIDMARSTAAVAAALADYPEADQIALIAGDLSGIQNFIYTISSEGALKSLRARSFYLELVAEEIVQQLLEKQALDLPRTSVIYAGGGNLYILAPKTEQIEKTINDVKTNFNEWLYDKFKGKIFLALACHFFPVSQVATTEFAKNWNDAIKEVNKQKSRKFINKLDKLLGYEISYEQRCRVCHRDDTDDLQALNHQEPDSVQACPICQEMFELGGKLLEVKAIIRSTEKEIKNVKTEPITFELSSGTVYYHVFDKSKPVLKYTDTTLLVNNWTIEDYKFRFFRKAVPLFLGQYAQQSSKEEEQDKTMRAGEFCEKSQGIKRVGYLRMDVDNLGKIFAKGFQNKTIQNLPRITGLSRLMTYFFKVYLNSLAKNRCTNLPKGSDSLNSGDRPNLLFIYAGGDDLFISGTWNEIVDFAFDIYQAFRGYTGYNPNITLSGGISLADVKFPLYQAANESGEAENKAKGNGRDSLGLFGEVFKWDEWLGNYQSQVMDEEIRTYLGSENLPSLFGILPFVKKLYNIENQNYSRSFVRNLLATAQVQNQMIKEIEEKHKNRDYQGQERDIRYYLHLPKIAYTLARLPKQVLEDDEEFRKSLKSPYNAPYFQVIATWIELLNRKENHDSSND